MSSVNTIFNYDVTDVNNSVRETNVLLRAANAVRLSYRDINDVMKDPTFTKIMWMLIQLSRTYNALRRLNKLLVYETNKAGAIINFIIPDPTMVTPPTAQFISTAPLSVRVDAFLDNRPVRLDRIDLSNLPEESSIMIQAIMEEDAEITVRDAQQILTERILHPEESTGDLSTSIGWMSEVFGVRIFANMYYSAWVEEGHMLPGGGYFSGHHYMADAVARAKLRLPEKLREQLNGLISNES